MKKLFLTNRLKHIISVSGNLRIESDENRRDKSSSIVTVGISSPSDLKTGITGRSIDSEMNDPFNVDPWKKPETVSDFRAGRNQLRKFNGSAQDDENSFFDDIETD
jgi:hypothetical protein